MINKYEENFVKKFVINTRQERLIFELNGKKRQNGIGRFCHSVADFIKMDKIIAEGNKLYTENIISIINKYNIFDKWYILACNENIDRKICKINEALELVLGNGMAAIIISDSIAIIETKQCYGTSQRYILHC
ncbi:MAG: hypothetical protein K2I82_00350 [Ruminococcus sp.]|nr:hypothetical protein [Ruminococcus sp.]